MCAVDEDQVTFKFEELSESAKERVRDEFRVHHLDHEWWDATYEDFINVAACLGFSVRPADIEFCGFGSQGDGASFTGGYAGDCAHLTQVQQYAPQDEELARIATTLDVLRVEAMLTFNTHWRAEIYRYSRHARSIHATGVVLNEAPTPDYDSLDAEDVIQNAARDLANWLYEQLEAQHDYLLSPESIDPCIVDYGCRYDEDGATI